MAGSCGKIILAEKLLDSPQWNYFNLYATGFKWLQSTFAYDIIFTGHLNFSTWFKKTLLFQEPKKI